MSPDLVTPPAVQQRWKTPVAACVTVMTLVFLCGAVVGALAMNLGLHSRMHRTAAPFWTASGKAVYLERVRKELDLTPTQTAQMESILDDFSKYYRTVLSDGKARILMILNPEQKEKFNRILQESQRP